MRTTRVCCGSELMGMGLTYLILQLGPCATFAMLQMMQTA